MEEKESKRGGVRIQEGYERGEVNEGVRIGDRRRGETKLE